MDKAFQRMGSESNSQVGRDFELVAKKFFQSQGLSLNKDYAIPLGVHNRKKEHKFDLGNLSPKTIVECKSHRWTSGNNIPSAKITVWNEAMYYFHLAPDEYRKIMFVLRDFSVKRDETLAQFYLRTRLHLVPDRVEFWEFDELKQTASRLR